PYPAAPSLPSSAVTGHQRMTRNRVARHPSVSTTCYVPQRPFCAMRHEQETRGSMSANPRHSARRWNKARALPSARPALVRKEMLLHFPDLLDDSGGLLQSGLILVAGEEQHCPLQLGILKRLLHHAGVLLNVLQHLLYSGLLLILIAGLDRVNQTH